MHWIRGAITLLIALAFVLALSAAASAASNGHLPRSKLAPAAQGGCVTLERNAARAWNAMQVRAGRLLPVNGCDSAYRTFARQVFWRRWWCARGACGNAAIPGLSNHGWGRAVDIPPGVRRVVDRMGHRYGWCKNARWAGPKGRRRWCSSDAPHEAWHVRYTPGVWRGGLPNMPVLKESMRRREVKTLNRRLRVHATTRYCRRARGPQFGVRTRICTIRFQRHHRLAGDGIVGPATWKRLIAKPRRARRG